MKHHHAIAKRPPGHGIRLCALLLLALAGTLCYGSAWAARVQNTAQVSYGHEGSLRTVQSNTVVFDIMPIRAPVQLGFRRYDADADASSSIPIDGGMCKLANGGFISLPAVTDGDGSPLDPGKTGVGDAPGYYVGEPVLITVADPNRNADPAVRELVEVELTTTTGDAETLRLLETGNDTGLFAGAIQSVPVPPAPTPFDCRLSLEAGVHITARYTDADLPLGAISVAATSYAQLPVDHMVLRLEQQASRPIVEVGDFLQYTLVLRNIHGAPALATRIDDVLPPGVSYRAGSLRIGQPAVTDATTGSSGMRVMAANATATASQPSPTPAAAPVSMSDGRHLRIDTGDLPPGTSVIVTFVAEVGPAARGPELVNFAVGSSSRALKSNDTDTVVRMQDSLATSAFTIIGRVLQAEACNAPADQRKGVPNVRILLEDGTYASTDVDGAYHFEGVRPGTHVAQMDLATLPAGFEAADCVRNTRHAGRGYSQFVEAQGGMLARADFVVRPAAAPVVEAGASLRLGRAGGTLTHEVALDGTGDLAKVDTLVILAEGTRFVPGSATLDGAPVSDPELRDNFATFRLGGAQGHWSKLLRFEATSGPCASPDAELQVRAVAMFESAAGGGGKTQPAEARMPCPGGDPPGRVESARVATTLQAAAARPAASASLADAGKGSIPGDVEAAGGGDVDWLKDQAPGRDWLFPAEGYNPRAPVTRVVVKQMADDKVTLSINGEKVGGLAFQGKQTATSGAAASIWRSVHLRDGDNVLEATITDRSGAVVAHLTRNIHYAVDVARAEFLPGRSRLVADGLHRPVIAVRMLDRFGKPARHGLSGEFSIAGPYQPAVEVGEEQDRRFAGMTRQRPTWQVEGDEGIAWIELAPTTVAGSFTVGFDFGATATTRVHQQIDGWLKSEARDWIVVGFAKGSIGYDTLADNMQALPEGEDGSGLRGDGQVSLYAKGRVLGDWLLTIAYDSDKPTDELRRRGLLSVIDPQQYYTLYGDGTYQGYDAASAEKIYLKLERDQFYALFGDFQTGLDRNELSRYQRTLNGVKVEYHGPLVGFNGFAAKTSQNFAHEEIPGDGTSGLYRLSHAGILMNSERIRMETRDRYHSEQIVGSRELARHIDYDIDYANGTLFFREPIASRDFDFNPNFIVVDYETRGGTRDFLNAGGRAGVRLMDGRLEAGVSYIRDEDMGGRNELAGLDAKFHLTANDDIRAEAATTRGDGQASGDAWLLEWQHRSERFNLLTYARRYGIGFGLGQQGASQGGTYKVGGQGQWRINEHFSLQGEAYRVENLADGAVRNAARAEIAYRGDGWGAQAGLQWAHDKGAGGKIAESRQVTLGANRRFLDGKLELTAKADLSLGGRKDSVDFPTRLQVGAAYAVTPNFRVLAAQEYTDGKDRDTATTRFGFEATPWKDARLTSTLNQSRISEYGPRTFALFGLDQKFRFGEHWSFDVAVDSSHAFDESGNAPLVVDPSQPIATGGIRDGGALTEDFVALSTGATYHTELWAWNVRAEGRQGDSSDRLGFTTAFLRQIRDGVAMSASAQAFSQRNADGSTGILGNAQLSWAYRPLGSNWSMLDKLEFRLDELNAGTGESILGNATLAANGDARSARIINNFVLNYAASAWQDEANGAGNVLDLDQRSQLSVYYGSKYVLDSYDGDDYSGYSDILGTEWRYDISPRIDVGIRASVMHSWSQNTFAWAFGPQVGFSPFTNTWVSVGYNIRGFDDRDFDSSHHTAKGAYLVFRMKFDQGTLGLDRAGNSIPHGDEL